MTDDGGEVCLVVTELKEGMRFEELLALGVVVYWEGEPLVDELLELADSVEVGLVVVLTVELKLLCVVHDVEDTRIVIHTLLNFLEIRWWVFELGFHYFYSAVYLEIHQLLLLVSQRCVLVEERKRYCKEVSLTDLDHVLHLR